MLETLAPRYDISLEFEHFDWSCERYLETGAMMPADGIAQLAEFDAIYLGAVGFPTVLDHVSLWGLLNPDPARVSAIHQSQTGKIVRRHAVPIGRQATR